MDDPISSIDDPIISTDDPLISIDDPIGISMDDPILSTDDPVFFIPAGMTRSSGLQRASRGTGSTCPPGCRRRLPDPPDRVAPERVEPAGVFPDAVARSGPAGAAGPLVPIVQAFPRRSARLRFAREKVEPENRDTAYARKRSPKWQNSPDPSVPSKTAPARS